MLRAKAYSALFVFNATCLKNHLHPTSSKKSEMSSLQRFFVASCTAVSRPRFDWVELPKGDKRKAPINVLQAPILAAQLFLPIFGQTRSRRRRRWPSPRWVSGTVGCCQGSNTMHFLKFISEMQQCSTTGVGVCSIE